MPITLLRKDFYKVGLMMIVAYFIGKILDDIFPLLNFPLHLRILTYFILILATGIIIIFVINWKERPGR